MSTDFRSKEMTLTGMDKLLTALRAMQNSDEAIQRAVVTTTLQAVERLSDYITELKLIDTGAYRRSITADFPAPLTGRVGTNIEYAMVLEFGFNGSVNVRQHKRKTKSGKSASVKRHSRKMVRPGYLVFTTVAPFIRRDFNRNIIEEIRKLRDAA